MKEQNKKPMKRAGRDKALAEYTEAIRLDPNDADAYNNRGIADNNNADYAEALADFTEALRIAPHYGIAKTGLKRAQRRGK